MNTDIKRINIIIVEDHPMITGGLKMLLRETDGYYIIGDFIEIPSLLDTVNLDPDLIILDINLPGINGMEGIDIIRKKFPGRKVIAHTGSDHLIQKLQQLGFDGCVVKNCRPPILIEAITSVMNGTPYFNTLQNEHTREEKLKAFQRKYNITDAELDIIKMVILGYSNHKIAGEKFRSEFTIKTHRRNIYEKTGVSNTAELTALAASNGIFF